MIRISSKLLPEAPNSSTCTGGHHICTTFMLTLCLLGRIFFDLRIYIPMIYKHHSIYPKTMPKILISSLRWPAFTFGTNVKGMDWCHTSNGSFTLYVRELVHCEGIKPNQIKKWLAKPIHHQQVNVMSMSHVIVLREGILYMLLHKNLQSAIKRNEIRSEIIRRLMKILKGSELVTISYKEKCRQRSKTTAVFYSFKVYFTNMMLCSTLIACSAVRAMDAFSLSFLPQWPTW